MEEKKRGATFPFFMCKLKKDKTQEKRARFCDAPDDRLRKRKGSTKVAGPGIKKLCREKRSAVKCFCKQGEEGFRLGGSNPPKRKGLRRAA